MNKSLGFPPLTGFLEDLYPKVKEGMIKTEGNECGGGVPCRELSEVKTQRQALIKLQASEEVITQFFQDEEHFPPDRVSEENCKGPPVMVASPSFRSWFPSSFKFSALRRM